MPRTAGSLLTSVILIAALPTFGQQEMATRDLPSPPTFSSKVNLVLVPVIVRDRKGEPIGTLKKEDFDVYDKGKLQVIEKFSVEKAGSQHVEFEPQPPTEPGAAEDRTTPFDVAERFTAFLFDDLHLSIGELMYVRQAAERHLVEGILPTERVALFSTSGRTSLDLTSDREAIVAKLRTITPNGQAGDSRRDCPPMTYYMADFIVNKNDPAALNAATADTLACANMDPATMMSQARAQAESQAQRTVSLGEADSRLAIINLKNVIRRLATMNSVSGKM